ncbi:MAG: deoxyribonuclease IV [Thermodesulfobacteriota bacterium]
MKFGAHVSIAGGIEKAPLRAHELGCECFQIFTRSPRGGSPPPLDSKTIDTFLSECSKYKLTGYYVHTPYYINLASKNESIRSASISVIKEELERGTALGVKHIMTHLGSSKGLVKSEAVNRVADSLRQILDNSNYETKLLLENAAGQGETIGDSFEELAEILDKVQEPNLGICLDTAHLLASGYDVRTDEAVKDTIKNFDSIVSLDKLKLLHGNDSKAGLGERKDRHEHIGQGRIGETGFKSIVNNPHLKYIDMIVETPIEKVEDDIKNLKRLKEIRNK